MCLGVLNLRPPHPIEIVQTCTQIRRATVKLGHGRHTHAVGDVGEPDGTEIGFWSRRNDNVDVWIIPAAGGEERRVTEHPESDLFLQWSPDGRWLIFQSDRTGIPSLWRVPTTGGEPELWLEGPVQYPRWSIDGTAIYYLDIGGEVSASYNIWAHSTVDGSRRRVTDLTGRPGVLGSLALATDGAYLYFTRQQEIGDLWVMDVE